MRRALPGLVVMLFAGCAGSPADTTPTSTPTSNRPASVGDPSPGAGSAPTPGCFANQRQFGTTCCESVGGRGDDRFPGMVFLDCTGPQIGQPCRKKSDCDVACSCDRGGLLSNMKGAQGPADGTRGVTGRCNGTLQIGVWMCELDEDGRVTHVIID